MQIYNVSKVKLRAFEMEDHVSRAIHAFRDE
jgi:hypothetical protein